MDEITVNFRSEHTSDNGKCLRNEDSYTPHPVHRVLSDSSWKKSNNSLHYRDPLPVRPSARFFLLGSNPPRCNPLAISSRLFFTLSSSCHPFLPNFPRQPETRLSPRSALLPLAVRLSRSTASDGPNRRLVGGHVLSVPSHARIAHVVCTVRVRPFGCIGVETRVPSEPRRRPRRFAMFTHFPLKFTLSFPAQKKSQQHGTLANRYRRRIGNRNRLVVTLDKGSAREKSSVPCKQGRCSSTGVTSRECRIAKKGDERSRPRGDAGKDQEDSNFQHVFRRSGTGNTEQLRFSVKFQAIRRLADWRGEDAKERFGHGSRGLGWDIDFPTDIFRAKWIASLEKCVTFYLIARNTCMGMKANAVFLFVRAIDVHVCWL